MSETLSTAEFYESTEFIFYPVLKVNTDIKWQPADWQWDLLPVALPRHCALMVALREMKGFTSRSFLQQKQSRRSADSFHIRWIPIRPRHALDTSPTAFGIEEDDPCGRVCVRELSADRAESWSEQVSVWT